MKFKTKLLHIDGLGGLSVGVLVLLFNTWLSELYGLPQKIVIFMGVVNLIYGSYSTTLALRSDRPLKLIVLLVFANLTWTGICFVLLVKFSETLTIFGLLYIIGEGLYVGWLGCLEWRWRKFLQNTI